jgi:cell wall-associated NlpC family hydrolase
LIDFKKIAGFSVCVLLFAVGLADLAAAQERGRVVKTTSSRPLNQPPAATTSSASPAVKNLASSRPVLTNEIVVDKPLVKKTGESSPVKTAAAVAARASAYASTVSGQMMNAIETRLGIPYRYGSTGPNRYDCSGFVWSVFNDAGFGFLRSSASNYWREFEPVTGDERFKFGTLVFFNGLGHVGIVADADGFYHASSSKGITYSKFAGYWEKRIVGFRRVPATVAAPEPVTAAAAAK